MKDDFRLPSSGDPGVKPTIGASKWMALNVESKSAIQTLVGNWCTIGAIVQGWKKPNISKLHPRWLDTGGSFTGNLLLSFCIKTPRLCPLRPEDHIHLFGEFLTDGSLVTVRECFILVSSICDGSGGTTVTNKSWKSHPMVHCARGRETQHCQCNRGAYFQQLSSSSSSSAF